MAESARLRGLGSIQRPRTPLTSPLPLFPEEYDGSHDHHHRYHSIPGFSPQRLQTRRAVHKVSSLLSLNIGGKGESRLTGSPSPTATGYASSFEDNTHQDAQAPSPRDQLNTWHNPTLIQMIESLQAAMMAKRDALAPIPIKYNSYVLAMIEGFAQLQQQLQAKDSESADLKQLREKELEGFRGMSEEWIQRESEYKAEIKRLELLLAKESKDGVASVALARSGTLVDRSMSKKFQARLQRMSGSHDNDDADEKPPLRRLNGTVHFPRGNTHHRTIGNISRVLNPDSDIVMSRAVQKVDIGLTRGSRQEQQRESRVRTLRTAASFETRQQGQQATYIPTGVESSSGSNRHVRVPGKPSQYDIEMAQQLLDSTSSSGSTISTDDGDGGARYRAQKAGKYARRPLSDDKPHGEMDTTGMGLAKSRATFVGMPSARLAKSGREQFPNRQTSAETEEPVTTRGKEKNARCVATHVRSGTQIDGLGQSGGDAYPASDNVLHAEKILHDMPRRLDTEATFTSEAERRQSPVQSHVRRPRGFSFMAGDDVLPVTPPASAATFENPRESVISTDLPHSSVRPLLATELVAAPDYQEYSVMDTSANLKSNLAPASIAIPTTPARALQAVSSSASGQGAGRMPTSESTGSVIYVGRNQSSASTSSGDGKRVSATHPQQRHGSSAHRVAARRRESDHNSPRDFSPGSVKRRPCEPSRRRSSGSSKARGRGGLHASSSTSSIPEQGLQSTTRESPAMVSPAYSIATSFAGTPSRQKGNSLSSTVSSDQLSTKNTPVAAPKRALGLPVGGSGTTARIAAARAIAKLNQKNAEVQNAGSSTSGPGSL